MTGPSKLIDHEMKCSDCNGKVYCEVAMKIIDDDVIKTLQKSFPGDSRFNEPDDGLEGYVGVE